MFTAHAAYGITSEAIGEWDAAYGWGDHADAGYATTNAAGQIATNVASDWSRWAATNDIAWSNSIGYVDMRLRGGAENGGLAFFEAPNATFQTLGIGEEGCFWRLQIGEGVDSAFTGKSVPLWSISRDKAELTENLARTNELFPMWMGGIRGDGIVSSNGTLAVESNLVVGTGIVNDSAISNWDAAYGWGDHGEAGYLTAETDDAAMSAVAAVSGRVDVVEGWGDHAEAGYATGTPVYVESDPIFSATNAWLVRTNDSAYTATVEKAASAVQSGDSIAALTVTNLTANGNLTILGRDVKSRDAVSVGPYGAAFGSGTSANDYGFAAGNSTSAGDGGFAAGSSTSAGTAGFAAGSGTSAGECGFAAGFDTTAGDFGFAAGRAAKGALGSFVFADNSTGGTSFNRTNRPNEFSARAAGGVYFDTPMMAVTGTVSAGSFAAAAGATNLFIRPDGGTNTVSFDESGNMIVAVDGTAAVAIGTNGNVGVRAKAGIGTLSPEAELDVVGNAIVRTNLTVQGVTQIILPTATNGLVSGTLWNDGGTVKVMP